MQALVVEGSRHCEPLASARLAAAGRGVFAIPGSIHSPLAHRCHQLVREGAKLVADAADSSRAEYFVSERTTYGRPERSARCPCIGQEV